MGCGCFRKENTKMVCLKRDWLILGFFGGCIVAIIGLLVLVFIDENSSIGYSTASIVILLMWVSFLIGHAIAET